MAKLSDEGGERHACRRWPLIDSAEFARRSDVAVSSGSREERAVGSAWAMARAALLLSGEVGFEQMTVEQLLDRSGSNRDRFYRTYRDKAHCFTVGYRAAIEELCDRLLEACARGESWATGMRASLLELSTFLASEPSLARGLIVEAPLVGDPVMTKRREVFDRLREAVDRARREPERSAEDPPEITAEFVVAGINAEVVRTLHNGIDFADLVPDLLYLSLLFYFGAGVAQAEVRRLG